MGTAIIQGQIWGVRARDWAEVQEGMYAPLFDAVLRETAVGANTALSDIGCGSGMFCQMAAKLDAQVSGLDAAEPLLAIARERTPGDFRAGEMEEFPYANQTFDVVAGFNSFQFAASTRCMPCGKPAACHDPARRWLSSSLASVKIPKPLPISPPWVHCCHHHRAHPAPLRYRVMARWKPW